MANVYLGDNDYRARPRMRPPEQDQPDLPAPAPPTPAPVPAPAPAAPPSGRTREEAENIARNLGVTADPSAIESFLQGRSSVEEYTKDQQRRAAPTEGRIGDSQGPLYDTHGNLTSAGQAAAAAQRGASRTNFNYADPGDQFDDPYTKALEGMVKQQLASIQQPQSNPALDQLLGFLNTQFQERSQNPGYSPAEQALLRTQALDPIEQDRAAAQKRSLERTASRGFLPSSGLTELDSRDIDLDYDRLRGAAQRDLGINAINRRDQNLNQAITLGQLAGIQIPGQQRVEDQQRRNEALSLSSLLYNLPRQAMNDNLAVISGSPLPGDLFSQAIQLLNAQNQQRAYNQQQNAQFWGSIGQVLAGLFQ